MQTATVRVGDVMKDMTVEVRVSGVKRLSLRVTLAKFLIRLACRVLGTKCRISLEE